MSRQVFSVVCLVLCALGARVLIAEAQGPKPNAPSVSVGTAFTYQGQLKKNGAPMNGSCYLQFNLYSDAGGTNLVAGPVNGTPNPVNVTNGLFTVQIDFGSSAFQGDARWLQTMVKCGSDSAYTPLSLQSVTPAPYALYSMKTAWGQSMGGAGNGLYARSTDSNGLLGIGDAGMIINPIPIGLTAGVYGESPQEGVWGQTYASGGMGVAGANSVSGNYGQLGTSSYGVYGASPAGIGVEGINTNTNNFGDIGTSSSGVHGYGQGTGSDGVIGVAFNGGNGVTGSSFSSSGSGVYGANYAGGDAMYSDGNMVVNGNLTVYGQATGFFPSPTYDSGWLAISPGDCLSVSHNLGGDMNYYFVDLTFHRTDRGMSDFGIGAYYGPGGNWDGAWYQNLTNTSVQICTAGSALYLNAVRFRIWVYK